MILKCNQGHWKWYELVKLNKNYQHARFGIYQIYNVREKSQLQSFCHKRAIRRPSSRHSTGHYTDSHFSCESKIGRVLWFSHASVKLMGHLDMQTTNQTADLSARPARWTHSFEAYETARFVWKPWSRLSFLRRIIPFFCLFCFVFDKETTALVCIQPWCNPLWLTGLKAPTNNNKI